MQMTMDEAVLHLRRDKRGALLMRDTYLDSDGLANGERFLQSGEFAEVLRLLGERRRGAVVDLGAGNGIASYAFSRSGARVVYALEPDPSSIVGRGAITQITGGLSVELLDAFGENIPLPDGTVDVVYARQVLHHTRDLGRVLQECARVLKSGGILLACREHVIDNARQLRAFLRDHPVHQLVGNENAFLLETYLHAIRQSGLKLQSTLGPVDSIINAYPGVRTRDELERLPQRWLQRHLGAAGTWLGTWSPVQWLVWKWLKRPTPGRLYTFLTVKA